MEQRIDEHLAVVEGCRALLPAIEHAAGRLAECLSSGGRLLWIGNGGSAADAQHMAAELVGRFARERRALPAIALATDGSVLTALGNDYGFEQIFARQLEALCRPGDALVALSTSGASANVLRALETAGAIGAWRLGLTGAGGGAMAERCELCLQVPSHSVPRIQECHTLIGHLLCEAIEAACAQPP